MHGVGVGVRVRVRVRVLRALTRLNCSTAGLCLLLYLRDVRAVASVF